MSVELVGQFQLRNRVMQLVDNNSFPRTSLLLGPSGQGKRTVAYWIAEKLGAEVYLPPDNKVDSIREIINHSRTLSVPTLYLLSGGEDMTVQAQNSLLKLAEEPPENAYIVVTALDDEAILPTILSRSVKLRMNPYTSAELEQFTDDKVILEVATNPGEVQRLSSIPLDNMLAHADKVVANIGLISASNAFNILKGINKENHMQFLSILEYAYGAHVRAGNICTQQLRVLSDTKQLLNSSKSINKQNALEMMFVRLREVARNELPRT